MCTLLASRCWNALLHIVCRSVCVCVCVVFCIRFQLAQRTGGVNSDSPQRKLDPNGKQLKHMLTFLYVKKRCYSTLLPSDKPADFIQSSSLEILYLPTCLYTRCCSWHVSLLESSCEVGRIFRPAWWLRSNYSGIHYNVTLLQCRGFYYDFFVKQQHKEEEKNLDMVFKFF